MTTMKKHVYSTSLEGAKKKAEVGHFLSSQAEVNAAARGGNLYCVEVEIECHSVTHTEQEGD